MRGTWVVCGTAEKSESQKTTPQHRGTGALWSRTCMASFFSNLCKSNDSATRHCHFTLSFDQAQWWTRPSVSQHSLPIVSCWWPLNQWDNNRQIHCHLINRFSGGELDPVPLSADCLVYQPYCITSVKCVVMVEGCAKVGAPRNIVLPRRISCTFFSGI